MVDELIPPSQLSSFFQSFNLPEFIAGPAGKAISRLIAGAVEIPAAYLDDFAQSIKSKTAAKQLVAKEVATAAAKLAANDTDIVARAAHSLLAKEYRHQKNKEEIAKKTLELLVQETPSDTRVEHAQAGSGPASSPREIDEDWLNVFERYAEDASTERMQELWARILAGEIRSPKSFSLKTLRFASELDQETARLFEKYLPQVCNGRFLPKPQRLEGSIFAELVQLEDAGLLAGVTGLVGQTFKASVGSICIVNQGHVLLINVDPGDYVISFPSAMLTKIGLELSRIPRLPFSSDDLKQVVSNIPKMGIKSIILRGNPPETLWPEPTQRDSAGDSNIPDPATPADETS
jgi:hypothetical protein